MRLVDYIRCRLGRPRTYRDYQDDGSWWFAMCYHCGRQAEVHEVGGPRPLPVGPALMDRDDQEPDDD